MLACIPCSRQLNSRSLHEQEEDDAIETPSTKQTIKALTAQIKDMTVEALGTYKNCKPCSGSSGHNRNTNYTESDAASASERCHYSYRRTTGSTSSSTPRLWGKEMEARLKGRTSASVSGRTESVVFMEEDEPKEWVAQVEPGVLITFVSVPPVGNDLKRIRFSREFFNQWQAQHWWDENRDKVMELYNVQKFNRQGVPLQTPPGSEGEISKIEYTENSLMTPLLTKERLPYESVGHASTPKLSNFSEAKTATSSVDASARSSSSSREVSVSNASDVETEWVEQDEPGVYITIRVAPGGVRELRRVRFSREKFGEMHAKLWWEANQDRIQEQYL